MTATMIEFYLRFWGRDADLAVKELGLAGKDLWFNTREERDALKEKLHRYGLVCMSEEGELTHKRTVAKMTFAYAGKLWKIEHDFGYEYPAHSAEFMFEDGNYGCDCNRSIFIGEKYRHWPHGEMECGHRIAMTDFEIELRS